jgi:SpoVK/Ycf46/Vps4 family AAA+-type ATPase
MVPVRKAIANLSPHRLQELRASGELVLSSDMPVSMEDFTEALKKVKPSVDRSELARYEDWKKKFGSE